MIYDYSCKECESTWEESLPYQRRDEPLEVTCPKCGKLGGVFRMVNKVAITTDSISVQRRAGAGWNDVLKKLHKTAGKESKIQTL